MKLVGCLKDESGSGLEVVSSGRETKSEFSIHGGVIIMDTILEPISTDGAEDGAFEASWGLSARGRKISVEV